MTASVLWFIVLLACAWVETIGVRTISRVRKFRINGDVAYAIVGHASVGWIVGAAAGLVVALFLSVRGQPIDTFKGLGIGAAVAAGAGLLVFEALTYFGIRRMKYANRPRRNVEGSVEAAGSV